MSSSSAYESLTLPEIREELKKRNAKVFGRKKELIERLEFYDKNSASGTTEPEFKMDIPGLDQYKDAHVGMTSNFPQFTMERLTEYLSLYCKDFDAKCRDMYEERYLRCYRVCTYPEKGLTFILSIVWAEMKKSVTYKVDLSLDENGLVQEAQCECGAGQGPSAHCKHVVTVLYASFRFLQDGIILSELSCTQVLQTFHKAKPHKGSPLKAHHLQTIRGNDRTLQFDPRPTKYRVQEAYPDHFRNVCLNYNGSIKMPVRHLFPPANIPALSKDHQYKTQTMEEHFLEKENLTQMTKGQANLVEEATRNQSACKQWGDERCKRLTASMFGSICKATERKDKQALARSLCMCRSIRTAPILHGIKYEAVAINKFEQLEGIKTHPCGLFICEEYPFLAATPNRIINDTTLVEVKCPYASKDKVINHNTVPYLKLSSSGLTLDTNHDYYYQIQQQMLCSGRKECKFVVFTMKELKVVSTKFDKDFVDKMVTKLKEFFDSHFKEALINHHFYKLYYSYDF